MKKNEVFKFTAPNGVKVAAIVLKSIFQGSAKSTLICYAQNRIFTYIEETYRRNEKTDMWLKDYSYGEVIVEYAVLPEYDTILELASANFDEEEANILFS